MTIAVLARQVETKTIIGLFWGPDHANIWDQVDQFADPYDYEYAVMRSGGLGFSGEEPAFPQPLHALPEDDMSDAHATVFDGARVTESDLEDTLYNSDRVCWKRFDASDEGVGLLRRVCDDVAAEQAHA